MSEDERILYIAKTLNARLSVQFIVEDKPKAERYMMKLVHAMLSIRKSDCELQAEFFEIKGQAFSLIRVKVMLVQNLHPENN